MSATAAETTVSFDPTIQQDQDLQAALKAATDYFLARYRDSPPRDIVRESSLQWGLDQLRGVSGVVPEVNEQDDDGKSRSARRFIPLAQARDTGTLQMWMSEILGELLRLRSLPIRERINQYILDHDTE